MRSLLVLLLLGLAACDNPLAEWQTDRLATAGFASLEAGLHPQALEQCQAASRLAPQRGDLRVCVALAALGMQRTDLFVAEVDGLVATKGLQRYPWLHQAVVLAFLEQRLPPGRLPFAIPPATELDGILQLLLTRADLTGPWGPYGDALSKEASPALQDAWRLARGGPLTATAPAVDCAAAGLLEGDLPSDPWQALARGVCQWRAGNPLGALDSFSAVQERRPDILLASFNKALVLAHLGRVGEAQTALAVMGPAALALSDTATFVARTLELFGGPLGPMSPRGDLPETLSARLRGLEEYRAFAP
jgi:hypothetical protein